MNQTKIWDYFPVAAVENSDERDLVWARARRSIGSHDLHFRGMLAYTRRELNIDASVAFP